MHILPYPYEGVTNESPPIKTDGGTTAQQPLDESDFAWMPPEAITPAPGQIEAALQSINEPAPSVVNLDRYNFYDTRAIM